MCRHTKSLYGLKQAPRQWYKKFDSFMAKHDFKRTESDQCVFIKRYENSDFLILRLCVDDMLIVGQDSTKIIAMKKDLSKSFATKDLGPVKQILAMRIIHERSKRLPWLSQERYIEKVLERFNIHKAKSINTPLAAHFKLCLKQSSSNERDMENEKKMSYSSAVSSLIYAMTCTRPDIAYVVGVVSRFLANPRNEHWPIVKWILRYLCRTSK